MHDTFTQLIQVLRYFSCYSTVRHQKGIVTTLLLTPQSVFSFRSTIVRADNANSIIQNNRLLSMTVREKITIGYHANCGINLVTLCRGVESPFSGTNHRGNLYSRV